jgi:hypothetical protein
MRLSRRGLFGGGVAFVTAPAIVRLSSLMPVSVPKLIVPPAYSLSDIITMTLRNRTAKLAEQVTRNNALLRMLANGNWVDSPGGIAVRLNMEVPHALA